MKLYVIRIMKEVDVKIGDCNGVVVTANNKAEARKLLVDGKLGMKYDEGMSICIIELNIEDLKSGNMLLKSYKHSNSAI